MSMMTDIAAYDIASMAENAIGLLCRLISTPSVSRDEALTADILQGWLAEQGVEPRRVHNSVWAVCDGYDPAKPTLMLNSHHDTVKPSPAYTNDPFTPVRADGRIYGLGSNDAGASLVSLATVFCALRQSDLPFNLMLAMTAEEEVSGEKGMRAFLPEVAAEGYRIDMALVGEPTSMQPAIAERGLVVLDCKAHGVAGHAARNEGVNAIYKAIKDIEILRGLRFDRVSPTLGDIKVSVTQIQAGRQHNVVPDECTFVVDVRTTDAYTNEETVEIIRAAIGSEAQPRSTRIRASVIGESHPLVCAAVEMGRVPFVSPTTSDMALMSAFPSLKMGPGESSRSHTADEYVLEDEIADGIASYLRLLSNLSHIQHSLASQSGEPITTFKIQN